METFSIGGRKKVDERVSKVGILLIQLPVEVKHNHCFLEVMTMCELFGVLTCVLSTSALRLCVPPVTSRFFCLPEIKRLPKPVLNFALQRRFNRFDLSDTSNEPYCFRTGSSTASDVTNGSKHPEGTWTTRSQLRGGSPHRCFEHPHKSANTPVKRAHVPSIRGVSFSTFLNSPASSSPHTHTSGLS